MLRIEHAFMMLCHLKNNYKLHQLFLQSILDSRALWFFLYFERQEAETHSISGFLSADHPMAVLLVVVVLVAIFGVGIQLACLAGGDQSAATHW